MKRYAILIANADFPKNRTLIPLETPLKDLRGLKSTLEDKSRGSFLVTYLENATTGEMTKAIEQTLNAATQEDLVLVYYSGHGMLDRNGKLSFAAADSEPGALATAVHFSEVSDYVANSPTRRIVILLDCCYSGAAGANLEPKGFLPTIKGDKINQFFQKSGYARKEPSRFEKKGEHQDMVAQDLVEPGDGVYLMTACSPVEVAQGDRLSGYGIFTQHIISGLNADAALPHPIDSSRRLITAHSLFAHVCRSMTESGQTPMLWCRDQTSADLVISDIELSGTSGRAVERANRWQLLREDRSSVLLHVGPTYILDNGFRFLDWNPAFEDLVARQLGLTRGKHVAEFLKHLTNWSGPNGVEARSYREFVPGKYPPVDIEQLDFPSQRHGLIRFEKIASQMRDANGLRIAWCVNLNVSSIEKDGDELWKHLKLIMTRESNWSKYAHCYDLIIGEFTEYKNLRNKIVDLVGTSRHQCLEIGCGTGNCVIRLLETDPSRTVTAIEGNEEMLCCLEQKLSAHAGLRAKVAMIKGDAVSSLKEEGKESYDACVMLNVLFALDNPVACLKEVHRVLRRGGVLVLSTSHENTNINKLFQAIYSDLERRGKIVDHESKWEEAYQRNQTMNDIIMRYTRANVREFLSNAGFTISELVEDAYVGCVDVVCAAKS